jgi:hypothetical protein
LDQDLKNSVFEFIPEFLENLQTNFSDTPESLGKFQEIILNTCLEYLREFIKLDNIKGKDEEKGWREMGRERR